MTEVDTKTEALLRLRASASAASGLVVLLGWDLNEFIDAILEEADMNVLRDVLMLLPLQKVDHLETGRADNDCAPGGFTVTEIETKKLTVVSVRRYKAWFTAAAPVRSMSTSELLGLFMDLRVTLLTSGPCILHVSDGEWWSFSRMERGREVADEIDRRMPSPEAPL